MRNDKANGKNKSAQTGKNSRVDRVDKALEQMAHLKVQGNKAIKDLKTGLDKIVLDVKDTAAKVTSDFS